MHHQSLMTYLKQAMTAALMLGMMLAFVSIDVEARRGGGGYHGGGGHVRAPRANIGGSHHNVSHNVVNRKNVNINNSRNVNVNRNVNVDVDRRWGHPVAGAAVAVGTAVAVGAIVSSLPPSCTTVIADGVTYQSCGGSYYAPRYDGPNVVYEVVPPPPGWNR